LRVGTEVVVALPPERVMSALAPLAEPAPALQPDNPVAPQAAGPAPEDLSNARRKTASLIAGMRGN
jgi:hypothetical protein